MQKNNDPNPERIHHTWEKCTRRGKKVCRKPTGKRHGGKNKERNPGVCSGKEEGGKAQAKVGRVVGRRKGGSWQAGRCGEGMCRW